MWMTVIPLNTLVKKKFDEYEATRSHPYLKQAVTSVAIATACCGIILPFDFVKVRIQMDPLLQKQSLVSSVQLLCRTISSSPILFWMFTCLYSYNISCHIRRIYFR